MPGVRSDFDQGLEDEAATVHPWMRHGQAGLVDDGGAEQQQVEIDRPRAAGAGGPVAAERGLDLQQGREQAAGVEHGVKRGRRVPELRVGGRDAAFGDGFVAKEAR